MEQAITFATISSIKQRIMDIQDAFQGGFERTKRQDEREYIDNDIVFLNNVKDLPLVNGSLRMDKFMSVICYTGKLQLEINMKEYTIVKNNILICRPDDTICNTMLSPDFEGAILCLSPNSSWNSSAREASGTASSNSRRTRFSPSAGKAWRCLNSMIRLSIQSRKWNRPYSGRR